MRGKNINFDDKKINKSNFYNNKKPFNIDDNDVNEVLISKRRTFVKKGHLSTTFNMMIMTPLDHYV